MDGTVRKGVISEGMSVHGVHGRVIQDGIHTESHDVLAPDVLVYDWTTARGAP